MSDRRIYDDSLYAHFVTFSCYKRRRLLDHSVSRKIVVETLKDQLTRLNGRCLGFVIMPDHVHALLWFPNVEQLSDLMTQWKRLSSYRIKKQLRELPGYAEFIGTDDPVWQHRYYDFNVYEEGKLREKIDYIHNNPIRAGLVIKAEEWNDSSARFYILGEDVGLLIGLN